VNTPLTSSPTVGALPAAPAVRAALAVELRAAADALEQLEAGVRLPQALEEAAQRHRLAGASRAALQDMTYGTVRRLATVKALAASVNRRPPAPALAALQWVVIGQILHARQSPRRHEAVLVDQAVRATRLAPVLGAGADAFINATLRRLLREVDALLARVEKDPVNRWNYPMWWIEAVRADHPRDWEAILACGNRVAPMVLRVNRRRTQVQALSTLLWQAGHANDCVGPVALRLARSTDPTRLPGFGEGLFSVQDAGAQMAAPLLEVQPGHRVLDACAAPGGKSAHLLELADCALTALDVDETRLSRVRQTLDRLGLNARLCAADACETARWWDGELFDRILLDAPCSASGIVRRQPDVRWLRRRGDLATLGAVQAQLLNALWPLLKPGGKLLYATCSVFHAEGEGRVGQFMAEHPQAVRVPLQWHWPAEGGLQPVAQLRPACGMPPPSDSADRVGCDSPLPARDHDGFFYALLQKPT
jgi:16S rRNA (cytosine967-C5)-methyltransferase